MSGGVEPAPGGLRARVVRGVAVNAGVLALVDAVVLVQGLVVTRLLGPEAIGLYGVVTVTAMTIVSLKRVGIDEAFVAQEAADQETEFQHALRSSCCSRPASPSCCWPPRRWWPPCTATTGCWR